MAIREKTLVRLKQMHLLVQDGMAPSVAAAKVKTSAGNYRLALKEGIDLSGGEKSLKPTSIKPLLLRLPGPPKKSGLVAVAICRPDQVASLLMSLT